MCLQLKRVRPIAGDREFRAAAIHGWVVQESKIAHTFHSGIDDILSLSLSYGSVHLKWSSHYKVA